MLLIYLHLITLRYYSLLLLPHPFPHNLTSYLLFYHPIMGPKSFQLFTSLSTFAPQSRFKTSLEDKGQINKTNILHKYFFSPYPPRDIFFLFNDKYQFYPLFNGLRLFFPNFVKEFHNKIVSVSKLEVSN